MPVPHERQPDQGRIVASLAVECRMAVGEMAALYEHERAELAMGARITKFLHIFAIRNVLEVIRERGLEGRPSGFVGPALLDA
jgi:Protein of unknown function (DUF3562)